MKRHDSLAPVSRQHHSGLLTARLLQADAPAYKGMPTTPAGKRDYAVNFLEEHLRPHFRLEEETVFILARQVSEELRKQADQLEAEHRQLEQLILTLPEASEIILPEKLHETGKLLEQHIRTEERIFFELLQQEVPEEKLQVLQQQVRQHLH
ncbi:hemerythrin domain-containing protein [Pontibacter ruber]|uniref:Hemerythrin domain-containing protein n=1 Tax=Pontibacter ruber TaxID=1343895 RepID=A0ABW5D173_9BACT|nr:hemerythrin domain-containing protein [Pontibacter ruber]